MHSRRRFLGALGLPAGLAAVGLAPPRLRALTLEDAGAAGDALDAISPPAGPPERIARDEAFWASVARAFTVDRSLINLNNGGVSPSPAFVQEAMKRHLDYSNLAPTYTMWRILEPQKEGVRQRLARVFGADPEEIALTRNASEGLQICQLGFDLAPGDEILGTTQDYPRMDQTFRQREKREGVVYRQIDIPVPAEDDAEIVRRFEAAITPRTRLILATHMINLTGQILPVRDIARMARARGIPVIVDGAHSLAHFDFTLDELDCDYFATSLHKWLFAPHGTGLLYVRQRKIKDLWPLTPPPVGMEGDIRKFEEIGTHPAANALAVAEALTFHQTIGAGRKDARLVHLRDYWARPLLDTGSARLHTSQRPGKACGIATVEVEGVDSTALADWLWKAHRIIVTVIKHAQFEGVRVSPSVYTTHAELDRFVDAMRRVIKQGVPA